ncbi:stage III sporulation protein SpoIIIAB [Pullulanibacillus sp. KACC 23026]|uniref:stage III sporulation protein SpoIIIAB n=1 Tax=Pullulanibacillus sp. KACC 23026 TaxID=3028315 RepID=UPI0023AECB54|nr:stage III sporulation protein SpoIIIAB [Pullulanibacillus sp. KACC 23026]WEG14308.1 stage III sporulation protein SpoIIIAB [Pullulanibacillus sp. KACC 23026]
MKIIGIILIVSTTTLIGFALAKRYRERPRQLRQLVTALQSLESEIMFGLTPVFEAASHLVEQLPSPSNRFFADLLVLLDKRDGRALTDIWSETTESFWTQTALKQAEKEIWKQFGQTLGQSDRENQKKHIRLAISHLEREEEEARIAQQQYEKMTKSLGILGGLLIVLLLF